MTEPRETKAASMASTQEEQTPQSFEDKIIDVLRACRGSRKLVLLIVAVALLLDNMLLTSVVPIIPAFLFQMHHKDSVAKLNETLRNATPSPQQEFAAQFAAMNREKPKLLPEFTSSKEETFEGPKTAEGMNLQCTCRQETNGEFVTELSTFNQRELSQQQEQSNDYQANSARNWKYYTTSTTTEEPEPSIEVTEDPVKNQRHLDLQAENFEVGVMFASKPIVQAITNPFVGTMTNRIGYSIPMFSGFIIMFLATLIFAVGESFPTLLIARMLQGVGSACTSVAGMGMLADRYPDDRERGNAMAIALGGLALGVLIGPPFGGVLYEFIGKSAPFIILAFLALLDGLLQLLVLQPKITKEDQEGASLLTLIKDPYILVAAGALTFANAGIAVLEPALPLWMMDTMNASNWQQGAAFLPASISYLIGTNVFGPLGHRMGRWLASMIGLIVIALSLLSIPFAKSLDDLIIPNGAIGFAIGMVDSSMMPMLGYLVDIRHTSVYGSVYAIGDVAFCAGFVIGPLLSGTVGRFLGFEGLVIITALVCFTFAPFLFLLKNPPILNEEQILLQGSCVKYVNYTDDEETGINGSVGHRHTHSHDPTSRSVNRALQTRQTSISETTVTTGLNPFLNQSLPPTGIQPPYYDDQPASSPSYVH